MTTHSERRSPFFFWMSVVLLCLVFAGFTQTFFARPLFDVPAIPWYLYAHGILMTAWYGLLVVQTSLIAAGRTAWHRRLGVAGAVLAAALVVANVLVVLGLPARVAAGQYSFNFDYTASPLAVSGIVWNDLGALTAFAGFVTAAVALRRRPDAHKRLLLLGSIAILGPAYGRIVILMPSQLLQAAVGFGTFLGLMLAVVVHDALTTRRRFHPATLVALAIMIAGTIASGIATTSEAGRSFVARLETAAKPH